mmetsp:Transcript_14208/g.20998  ORF Transcript_14208/g.20998 Transcript_14208/m.20998 type:complete len:337 (-) Transcript_14208:105-1115(-)
MFIGLTKEPTAAATASAQATPTIDTSDLENSANNFFTPSGLGPTSAFASTSPVADKKKKKKQSSKGPGNTGRWSSEEHRLFLEGLKLYGRNWKEISGLVKTRNHVQIRTHAQKFFLKAHKSGPNTIQESDSVQPINIFKKRKIDNLGLAGSNGSTYRAAVLPKVNTIATRPVFGNSSDPASAEFVEAFESLKNTTAWPQHNNQYPEDAEHRMYCGQYGSPFYNGYPASLSDDVRYEEESKSTGEQSDHGNSADFHSGIALAPFQHPTEAVSDSTFADDTDDFMFLINEEESGVDQHTSHMAPPTDCDFVNPEPTPWSEPANLLLEDVQAMDLNFDD